MNSNEQIADGLETTTRRHQEARRALVLTVEAEAESSRIVEAANRVAYTEGEFDAYLLAQSAASHAVRRGDDEEGVARAIREIITGRLLLGADDSWSGRTNDAARTTFDGFRDAAASILRWVS